MFYCCVIKARALMSLWNPRMTHAGSRRTEITVFLELWTLGSHSCGFTDRFFISFLHVCTQPSAGVTIWKRDLISEFWLYFLSLFTLFNLIFSELRLKMKDCRFFCGKKSQMWLCQRRYWRMFNDFHRFQHKYIRLYFKMCKNM